MLCPICEKRKPSRYCPAKAAKICAVCCGTEREVTIDCPADCRFLISAHRYEDKHRKSVEEGEIPFHDVRFSSEAINARQPVVSGLGMTILKFAATQPSLSDPDAFAALRALADTYKTLRTGIYYEKPPDAPLQRALYGELAQFLEQTKQEEAKRAGFSTLKDSEILYVLVFLLRLGSLRTNGRPRSRRFLEFLRSQFPTAPELAREQPRIVVP